MFGRARTHVLPVEQVSQKPVSRRLVSRARGNDSQDLA